METTGTSFYALLLRLLISLNIIFITISALRAQELFNNSYEFSPWASLISNIHCTDSSIYALGTYLESNNLNTKRIFISNISLSGEINYTNPVDFPHGTSSTFTRTLVEYNGEFFLSGVFQDTIGLSSFFAKIDDLGNVEFFKRKFHDRFPGTGWTYPSYMTVDKNGDFLMLDSQPNLANKYYLKMIKWDSLGNLTLEKNIYHDQLDLLGGYVLAENDGYLLGLMSTNGPNQTNNLIANSYFIKTDFQGNKIWDLKFPNTSLTPRGIFKDAEGNYYSVCGAGKFIYVNPSFEEFDGDLSVFKFSQNGIIWEQTFKGGSPSDRPEPNNIFISHDSLGLIFSGHHINNENTSFSGIIGKISFEGDSLWKREFEFIDDSSKNQYNFVWDFKKTKDGFVLGGETWNNGQGVNQTGWLVKVDKHGCLIPGCQRVNSKEPQEKDSPSFIIYPNPANDYIYLKLEESLGSKFNLIVRDLSGKLILQKANLEHLKTYIINCKNWVAGQYIISIENQGLEFTSKRLIKI